MLELIVSSAQSMPVKDYLRKAGLSLTLRRKIKHQGSITCNDQQWNWNDPVQEGDCLQLTWPENCQIPPVSTDLTIRYEDEAVLVIDKPAGLMIHPTTRQDDVTLANAVMYYYQSQHQTGGFHPVHRLDRQTSGLILIAKSSYFHHRLANQDLKQLQRTYCALVTGSLSQSKKTIDAPIARKPGSIIERMVSPEGQRAITDYEVLTGNTNASLVKITLHTGRTHQIRVHFSSLGHPLLGDDLYGGATNLINRQALHAVRLAFIHPLTNQHVCVQSPLPADILTAMQQAGLNSSPFQYEAFF